MSYPIKDCDCEDFPCCVHADNFPIGNIEDYYCDVCGYCHPYPGQCNFWYEDDEE